MKDADKRAVLAIIAERWKKASDNYTEPTGKFDKTLTDDPEIVYWESQLHLLDYLRRQIETL